MSQGRPRPCHRESNPDWPGFAAWYRRLLAAWLAPWEPSGVLVEALEQQALLALAPERSRDFPAWMALVMQPWLDCLSRGQGPRLESFPAPDGSKLEAVALGCAGPESPKLHSALQALMPWRKGPFCLGGIKLDAEWRSDWKWRRLVRALPDLAGLRVLDVGCGNGWYLWRLVLAGARGVLGLEPYPRSVFQHLLALRLEQDASPGILPMGLEEFDQGPGGKLEFDLVLSMGVLYHCRSPVSHLEALARRLVPGGQVLVETLVILPEEYPDRVAGRPGQNDRLLLPTPGRYCGMANIHGLPTPALVQKWLAAAGFSDITPWGIEATTTAEQRAGPWMTYWSLANFLDPVDGHKTIEGLPAPRRGMFLARRPRSLPVCKPGGIPPVDNGFGVF